MTQHEHTQDFDWNDAYRGVAADYEPPDALFLSIAAGLDPGHALDIGCGAGGLVAALAERGWKVTGLDIAETAIEASRAVLEQRGVTAELEVANASTWQPTRSYDLITNSFALPTTKDERAAVFETIRSALRPGGTVALKEHDAAMTSRSFFSSYDFVTLDELKDAFGGFDLLRLEVEAYEVAERFRDGSGDDVWTAAILHARNPSGNVPR